MTNDRYAEQIQRIKHKLTEAKKADKELKVFGAARHKYAINEPTTVEQISKIEKQYSIELPDCYKAFLLNVGNGGIGWQNSAAGPFFGIYPFGKNINELIFDNTEKYLKNDCLIHPKMTDQFWKSLTKNIDDNEEISDQDYESRFGNLWAGILPIGSQGCTYIHGIVLNGQYKGRVVNLDIDRQKPQFAFENNFLDWYERWLDEVISGDLIKDTPGWFGYTKGGSEEQLLASFLASGDLEEKKDNLSGLLNKTRLSNQIISQIENLIKSDSEHERTLIQLLCKADYERAKPYLIELTKKDLCSVFQFIFWYAKGKSKEWLPIIENNLHMIDNDETFKFCSYLLIETKSDIGRLIEPFTKDNNEKIRVQAFYTLGKLKNKEDYLDCFIDGLRDKSNRVVHSTLQALAEVKDEKLLPYYKNIAERYPVEQDYILVNLNHRLADYGLTNKTIVNQNNIKQASRKWYEIWK